MGSPEIYSDGNGIRITCTGKTELKLTRVELGCSARRKLPPPGSRAAELLKLVADFVQGRPVSLPTDVLDLSTLSDFELKILQILLRNVPRGKVIAYAALAAMAGTPRGARAVGGVMRKNLFPLFFPCHRVIASDGTIGGFMGEQGAGCSGPALKKQLLMNEGVTFLPSGKVAVESIIRP
ncbi:MAG: MGMT family protein [Victivallaceae bacterium]|jgi:methylated-DNA-[protein]-cysteine S-methyltransferase